jgi:hypothetical protein
VQCRPVEAVDPAKPSEATKLGHAETEKTMP